MPKGFIFDWSGTLSDNFSKFHEVCSLMFRDFGGEPLSEEELKKNFTVPYMKFWNKYFPEVTKEMQDVLYEKYIHEVGRPGLHAGVEDVIKNLHGSGHKIFVVSSDWNSTFHPEVKASGLEEFFTESIGEVYDKSDTFLRMLKDHSLKNDHTYYIGDTDGDIGFGKAANIKTIGISWGSQHRDALAAAEPDFLIDDIKEMEKFC
ncbi:MAG: HAD family hydrolase [bacterium]